MIIDTLIIGQGLAGSLLAMTRLEKGERVLVVDNQHQHSATKVAAGIMNPIRGKRLVRNWDNDQDFDDVIQFYKTLERTLNTSFLSSHTLYRILTKADEQQAYHKKKDLPEYARFLNKQLAPSALSNWIHNSDFAFQIDPVYQVHTQALLDAVAHYLTQRNALHIDHINYNDIHPHPDHVRWTHIQAKQLIFCDGYKAQDNPFLTHLNFENAKGEILHLHCDQLPPHHIFNNGKWLCPFNPKEPHHYKFGTTSYWDFNDNLPEPTPTQQLENDLKNMLNVPYSLANIHAGVRPVLKERTPVFDYLKEFPRIGYINGLGGQGTYLAPLLIKKKEKKEPAA